MKKIIFALFISACFFSCKNTNEQKSDDQQEENRVLDINRNSESLTDSIQVNTIQIGSEYSEDKNHFQGSYPSTFYEFINKNEEDFIQPYLNEFEESAKKFDSNTSSGITFIQHFELMNNDANFISFLIERNTSYGNNFNDEFFTHAYDLKEEKLLNFSDFFGSKANFEKVVRIIKSKAEKFVREEHEQVKNLSESDKKQLWENSKELFDEGTIANDKNYHAFSWDKTGDLTIYFNKYQIASGSFGNIKVTLKSDEYKSLIDEKYLSLFNFPKEEISEDDFINELPTVVYTPEEGEVNCGEVPCIALTFDDGPSVHTPKLLDILKENNVKATFFVLGKSAKVQKNTIARIYQEGHQIGNHSWDHKDLKKLSKSDIEHEIYDTNDAVESITGEAPRLFRPPYGSFNETVKSVANMPIILWNLDPLDWKDRDAEVVTERIIKAKKNGIVLSHDIHKTTVEAMPKVIKTLKEKGFHLVTIDQLFAGQELKNGQKYFERK